MKYKLALLFLLTTFLQGCASSPMKAEVERYYPQSTVADKVSVIDNKADIEIFIAQHKFHSAVILPADSAKRIFPSIVKDYISQGRKKYDYWEFGWGDEKYFTAPVDDAFLAIRSMAYPTSALINVIGLHRHPSKYFQHIKYTKRKVTSAQYERMLAYIRQTFVLDKNNRPIKTTETPFPDRLFYKSRGEYAFFNNCNHWTAELLNVAGFPVDPDTLTAEGIFDQIGGVEFSK